MGAVVAAEEEASKRRIGRDILRSDFTWDLRRIFTVAHLRDYTRVMAAGFLHGTRYTGVQGCKRQRLEADVSPTLQPCHSYLQSRQPIPQLHPSCGLAPLSLPACSDGTRAHMRRPVYSAPAAAQPAVAPSLPCRPFHLHSSMPIDSNLLRTSHLCSSPYFLARVVLEDHQSARKAD